MGIFSQIQATLGDAAPMGHVHFYPRFHISTHAQIAIDLLRPKAKPSGSWKPCVFPIASLQACSVTGEAE